MIETAILATDLARRGLLSPERCLRLRVQASTSSKLHLDQSEIEKNVKELEALADKRDQIERHGWGDGGLDQTVPYVPDLPD